jgi:hypothetical protein
MTLDAGEGKPRKNKLLGRANSYMPLHSPGETFEWHGQKFVVRNGGLLSPRGDGWQVVEPVIESAKTRR